MWKLFIVLPILCSNCFPSVPQINAKVDIAFQTKKLQKCILDTTSHYAAQRVKSSDRLPFSSSQIQQLCLATSGQSDPTSTQPTTSLTSTVFVQPPTVTLDTSVSATLTTMQKTSMSTATAPVSATLSTPMHETTVSTTTPPTVSNTVVFGPPRPTMSNNELCSNKTGKNKTQKRIRHSANIIQNFDWPITSIWLKMTQRLYVFAICCNLEII